MPTEREEYAHIGVSKGLAPAREGMPYWLSQPTRRLVEALLRHDSSRQIAAGAAIGAAIGLTPKDNLLSIGLLALFFALRVNKAAGFASALMFAVIAPLTDAITHKVGLAVLMLPLLEPFFTTVYESPLGPWVGLHNSVTTGAFLLGLYLTYPVYLVVRSLCDRIRDPQADWLLQRPASPALSGETPTNQLGVGP